MTQRKIALSLGLGLMSCMFSTGCWSAGARPHSSMETLSEAPDEHYHRVQMDLDRDHKALAEDLDLLFLTDRPTRLTKWHGK